MKVDLAGRRALILGEAGALLDALAIALEENGCAVARAEDDLCGGVPDILVLAEPLVPDDGISAPALPKRLFEIGEAMAQRGAGRIVVLLSALAAVPARRFPKTSVEAGAAMLTLRALAMRLAPTVLVNAVGCGVIAGPDSVLLSGDASMLSHVPAGEPGGLSDIVHAVLFLCDPMNSYMTGQLLVVDGGWSPGYGRNF